MYGVSFRFITSDYRQDGPVRSRRCLLHSLHCARRLAALAILIHPASGIRRSSEMPETHGGIKAHPCAHSLVGVRQPDPFCQAYIASCNLSSISTGPVCHQDAVAAMGAAQARAEGSGCPLWSLSTAYTLFSRITRTCPAGLVHAMWPLANWQLASL